MHVDRIAMRRRVRAALVCAAVLPAAVLLSSTADQAAVQETRPEREEAEQLMDAPALPFESVSRHQTCEASTDDQGVMHGELRWFARVLDRT